MSGINKAFLVGYVGKDPELRLLPGNTAMLKFPLVTTEYFNKNGAPVEHVEWHNIVMWRGVAETAARVLRKGKLVYLEGKVATHSFEDKAGTKRFMTEIMADQFKLLAGREGFKDEAKNAGEEAGSEAELSAKEH